MGKQVKATFDQVNIVVSDMARAVAFYELLGADIADFPGPWAAHHRDLTSIGPKLSVEMDSTASVPNWATDWPPGRAGVVLGFRVGRDEDVDTLFEGVAAAGHVVRQPPHDAFWGARYAVVEDPDGNAVGLMGPTDRRRGRQPGLPS